MFAKRVSLLLGGFALCVAVSADSTIKGSGTLETVVKEVSKRQKSINSLQADFRQEKVLALLAEPQVSVGTFIYAKPNRVRWNYQTPKRVEMVIANGMMTTFYPDLNKAEKIEVKRFESRIFRYMGASGAIDELGKYFDFTFVDTKAERHYTLELIPKTRTVAKRVRRIKIWIERDTYLTSKFEYVEGDGDLTRYEFMNIRINDPVGSDKFALQIPPNVRVEELKLN